MEVNTNSAAFSGGLLTQLNSKIVYCFVPTQLARDNKLEESLFPPM